MIKAKNILAALLLVIGSVSASAQNELIVSQYMHNYFAVNPAFAGSRGGLSIFGSFRKQWTSIEGSPYSVLLTANTPMRHDKITAGLSLYTQGIHESKNTGLQIAVGYRTRINSKMWLGLALQPGIAFRSRDWSSVRTMDSGDEIFQEKETGVAPLLGFGATLYGKKFFFGVSTTSFFVTDDFERTDTEFAPADATYILTGGYWFDLSNGFALQPSALLDYNKEDDLAANISVSGIYKDFVWLTAAYRTTEEINIGAAYKPNERLKIAYTYTLTLGDLQSYSSGNHEISIQYDFIYKVRTVGHRFY